MTSEYDAYLETLVNSHRIRTVIRLYDANEVFLGTLDHQLASGQVDVDVNSEVERSATLTFADVPPKLLFQDEQQEETAIFADNMIGIEYIVEVPSINKDVIVPVFFGPVTRFERDGLEVTVEAQSKESLLQPPVVWGRYLKNAGLDFINADIKYAHQLLRAILRSVGEKDENMYFSEFEQVKLPKGFKLPKAPENLWSVCQKVVQAANARNAGDSLFRLFYDGRGKARVESEKGGGYTFTDDYTTGVLLNKPQISYDLDSFRNTVIVHVNRQDGITRHVAATLPNTDPMSAKELGRNDYPRFLVEEIDNDQIKKLSFAQNLADDMLDRLSVETVEVSFDCLPIPHLKPASLCKIVTDDIEQTFYANQFSLPLRAGDSMSVGFLKRMQTGPAKPRHLHWVSGKKKRRS